VAAEAAEFLQLLRMRKGANLRAMHPHICQCQMYVICSFCVAVIDIRSLLKPPPPPTAATTSKLQMNCLSRRPADAAATDVAPSCLCGSGGYNSH